MALRKLEGAFTPAQQVLTRIRSMLPRLVTSGVVVGGEPILYVEPEHVPTVLTFLRDHSGTACKQLTELTALDIPSREKRFEVCIPHLSPSLCTSRLLRHHSRMASCVAALLTDDPPPPYSPPPLSQLVYQLLSHDHNSRIRVKTLVGGHEGDAGVPSVSHLFSAANWLEREVRAPRPYTPPPPSPQTPVNESGDRLNVALHSQLSGYLRA